MAALLTTLRSSTFNPRTDVPGLVAWYDFSDATTLFTDTSRTTGVSADAQTIKGILDKSASAANGSDSVGCTYKTAIQNSKSVGRFVVASSNKLNLGTNVSALAQVGDITIIAAFAFSSNATFKEVISYQTNAGTINCYEMRGTNSAATPTMQLEYANGSTSALPAATSATDLNWHVQSVVHTVGVGVSFFADQGAVGTPTNSTVPTADASSVGYIGALNNGASPTFFMSGDIGEIVIYNSALSAPNRVKVEAYLKTKWGTP